MDIYFLGICGTAMGHAALLMKGLGHRVSGSDCRIYPPMSEVLRRADVFVREGYSETLLAELKPDLVVIGNAMSRGNPEVEWLLESRGIPYLSLPELLSKFVLANRQSIVVSGTHGKTTTSAVTTFLLRENGGDPGFFIGGVPCDFPSGAHLGAPQEPFVIEGDEYDTAFFDKRGKFVHYLPRILCVNNIEFDHADIFRDLADVRRSFSHLFRVVPRGGMILFNGDDPVCREMEQDVWWTNTCRVGFSPACDLHIDAFEERESGASFRLRWRGKEWGRVDWSLGGVYNARNAAMASLAAALAKYPEDPTRLSLEPLASFRGVSRRLENLFESSKCVIFEDFGHHPTAIQETLRSLRARYPGRRLWAVVEPRSNTLRTAKLGGELMAALAEADAVRIGAVDRAADLAAQDRLDTAALAERLVQAGVRATAFPTNQALFEALVSTPQPANEDWLVIFFSNGSFDGIHHKYAEHRKKEKTLTS